MLGFFVLFYFLCFWGFFSVGKLKAESDNLVFSREEEQEIKIKTPNSKVTHISGPFNMVQGSRVTWFLD